MRGDQAFGYDNAPMKQSSRAWRHVFSSLSATCLLAVVACSSGQSSTPTLVDGGSGSGASCDGVPPLGKADFCKACTISPAAVPNSCKAPRTVNACCTYVRPPSQELTRGTGLVRSSSPDPVLQLGCLDNPGVVGTSKPFTLKGFVRVFSSGNDSAGVKIEIYKEGANGALGDLVGTPVSTTKDGKALDPKPVYLKKCPDGGCTYREFTYAGVPSETPLIVKTSDAAGGEQWAGLYDYNVFFPNSVVGAGDVLEGYQPAAVAATDINTVASAAGGLSVGRDKGLLAGEVHDCGDVRVAGATVDTDSPHDGDMFYFGENEADPLPDRSRGALPH